MTRIVNVKIIRHSQSTANVYYEKYGIPAQIQNIKMPN